MKRHTWTVLTARGDSPAAVDRRCRRSRRRTGVHRGLLALVMVATFTVLAMSAQPLEAPSRETRERDVTALLRQSDVIAQCLSATIGTAISPLVGIAAISAVGYYRADGDTRSQLPWFNQPRFWLWAIGILAAVALKDTVGSAMPILKKPLDALELVENQVSWSPCQSSSPR